MNTPELLHEIDKRVARVEERLRDLTAINAKLDKIDARFDVLTPKVYGTAATVAVITTIVVAFLTKVLQ